MIGKRPAWIYVVLFAIALGLWSFTDPGHLPVGLLLGLLTLFSYRVPQFILKPTAPWLFLWGSLILAFFQFLVFADNAHHMLAVYDTGWVNAVMHTLGILIALQWYSWRSQQFNWLLFSQGLFLIGGGIYENTPTHRGIYAAGVALFFLVWLGYENYPFQRSKRYILQSALLLVVFLSLSTLMIRSTEIMDRRFNEMLNQWLLPGPSDWSGFSGLTRLQGGQSIRLSQKIAFVVVGDNVPDYWRGNILTRYENGTWTPEETLHAPLPYASAPLSLNQPNTALYTVQSRLLPDAQTPFAANTSLQPVEVFMKNHFNGLVFFPKETVLAALPVEAPVYQNRYGLLRRELRETTHHYTLWLQPGNQLQALYDENLHQENLQIPPAVKRALLPLAKEITRRASTPQQKAQAIEQWFHDNFSYSLSVSATPRDVDPTVDFVLHRKAAWCSWHASGMTLMLRSLGIPAHVVSGWRSMDYNLLARQWIVREKEAHDWVEILDTEQQMWMPYDPTPPGSLQSVTGSGSGDGWLQSLWTALKLRLESMTQALQHWHFQDMLDAFQRAAVRLLSAPLFYLFLLGFLALNQWLKKKKKHFSPQTPPLLYRPTPADYHQAYRQFEHWYQQRELSPPLHQDLLLWQEAVQAHLDAEERTVLSTLLKALLQWRFDPCLSAEELSTLQHTVKKSLSTLESLHQIRKLSRTNQDIIKE
jgi:hypothetical protein